MKQLWSIDWNRNLHTFFFNNFSKIFGGLWVSWRWSRRLGLLLIMLKYMQVLSLIKLCVTQDEILNTVWESGPNSVVILFCYIFQRRHFLNYFYERWQRMTVWQKLYLYHWTVIWGLFHQFLSRYSSLTSVLLNYVKGFLVLNQRKMMSRTQVLKKDNLRSEERQSDDN